ncbi:class I mannose-6-phosphate isomerase [Tepidanaerobacter acetatoxydans]|uniref:class I mannose-6-phosphate isomerase n=1 Tax=Tepidanaerobacter acetatoxydans TaxID=499229 RepID=UPI001BD26DD1|nr:class I mannose-6-phosphate isomerase [Tepidanaerobacter acetatoxydans]
MRPIICKPNYISTIWAGNRLTKIRGLEIKDGKRIGIAREICAYKNIENIIAQGEYAGKNLRYLIDEHHEELMGDDPATQLVRVAYIDAVDNLSIQVHPDAHYAETVENDFEKSESWYILDCDDGAYITAGTTITDKAKLRLAVENGTLEQYVRRIPVKKGDFAMIPAGMLHACGKHMLALEIGSYGGITYRIYDYGRKRLLDIEKGFAVLDPSLQCQLRSFPIDNLPESGFKKQTAIEHPSFCVDVVDIVDYYDVEKGNTYTILTAVEGDATVVADGEKYPLRYTYSMIIPAIIKHFKVYGKCRILQSYKKL